MLDGRVDLINVSCGNHEDPALFCRTHPSAFFERGVNVPFATAVKQAVKTPVACVGSLNDPAQMEQIIAEGRADYVEIGRALLADPYIPEKALRDEADDITPCLRCYECFGETIQCENIRCAVNPKIGLQLFYRNHVERAEVRKKVLVAGGGPAGMQAAITLAQRGHDVTLAEKADCLGGNLHPAGAAYFKKDIRRLRDVLAARVEKAGVKVRLNTEVTQEYIESVSPDVLFVAIGSEAVVPPIPGMDDPKVIMAADAELHPEKLGKRVVIMGGGLVGSEAAVSFHADGRECTILEMKPAIAEDVNPLYRRRPDAGDRESGKDLHQHRDQGDQRRGRRRRAGRGESRIPGRFRCMRPRIPGALSESRRTRRDGIRNLCDRRLQQSGEDRRSHRRRILHSPESIAAI